MVNSQLHRQNLYIDSNLKKKIIVSPETYKLLHVHENDKCRHHSLDGTSSSASGAIIIMRLEMSISPTTHFPRSGTRHKSILKKNPVHIYFKNSLVQGYVEPGIVF